MVVVVALVILIISAMVHEKPTLPPATIPGIRGVGKKRETMGEERRRVAMIKFAREREEHTWKKTFADSFFVCYVVVCKNIVMFRTCSLYTAMFWIWEPIKSDRSFIPLFFILQSSMQKRRALYLYQSRMSPSQKKTLLFSHEKNEIFFYLTSLII